MSNVLAQIGLISICGSLLYIIWKIDRYLHEKYEDGITMKSDDENDK